MPLLSCAACECTLFSVRISICERCFRSLRLAPPLCHLCGSPVCFHYSRCLFPAQKHEYIKSYTAGYWLVGQSFHVLKSWKRLGGTLFDRTILDPAVSTLTNSISIENVDAIVPVPQSIRRSLKLGRNPSEAIAERISKNTDIPLLKPFFPIESIFQKQAKNSLIARIDTKRRLDIDREIKIPRKILLVDDFMTSGRTLKNISDTLSYFGAREIHVYCLGVRPRFINRAHQNLNLKQA